MDPDTFFIESSDYSDDLSFDYEMDNHRIITIDFDRSFKSGQIELTDLDLYEDSEANQIRKYLSETYRIWYDIKVNSRGDFYLKKYTEVPTSYFRDKYLNSVTVAQSQLFGFKKGYYGHLIDLLTNAKLNCLIAGSAGLAATIPGINWEPNDIDLYVKTINWDSIMLINQVIKQSSHFYNQSKPHVVLIRKSLTLNWVIFDSTGEVIITIQLNLLNIRSWADIFICYHADMVCIGYEIQSGNIICLRRRWLRYLMKQFRDNPQPIYYCNLFNLDTPRTLHKACLKYTHVRGIEGRCLFSNPDQLQQSLCSLSSASKGSTQLFQYLDNFCHDHNCAISFDIRDLIRQDEKHPDMIDLKDLIHNHPDFSQRPQVLQEQITTNFGRLTDNDSYLIRYDYGTTLPYTQSRFHLFWILAIYANEFGNKLCPFYPQLIGNRGSITYRYIETMHAKLAQRRQLITKILGKHPVLYKDVMGHIMTFVWAKDK